ncbi:MAG: transglutaminase family protein [Vicinamibacteraceae bacterium]
MAIHVALTHRTSYRYDRLVSLSPQTIRLRPAPHCRTSIVSYSLRIAPETHFLNWLQDPHGNYLARAVFPDQTRSLEVVVDLVAEIAVINPFDFFLEPEAEQWPFTYDPALARDLAPFMAPAPAGPRLVTLLGSIPRRPTRTLDFLVALNQRLAGDIGYIIRLEPGVQKPEATLEKRTGSCRDTGWLLVELFRHLGFAARFVSGYLIQLAPDVKALDGPSGTAVDFTDLHAWAEVYVPGAGWIGLDPTSGLLAGEGHIPLVCTPQPESAAPISGAIDACEVEFSHHMAVTRVFEAPRVTKPYAEDEWARIDRLGDKVDEALRRGDVRLTMGGEPTFVSIDDPDGDEWNTTAMGPRKRLLAGTLLRRLKARFAPGGLLHYGQGKWYPGEPLPRWSLGCWWRDDGQPIWHDDTLIADEAQDLAHDAETARQFVEALATRLGVEPGCVVAGYEDVWYYLWKERRLPVNLDPLRARLDDPAERVRLAGLLERGLEAVVGYALPLARRDDPDAPSGWKWRSGPWFFRSEHLFLLPGDSPMGYRLPLDSLPWIAEGDREEMIGPDPFEPLPPLPPPADRAPRPQATRPSAVPAVADLRGGQTLEPRETELDLPSRVGEPASAIVRTALCVQARHGRLHVFLPPVKTAEDYLDLIGAIEGTAAALQMPVILEGEPPPSDPRLANIKVTPDPGVIEVNLQPAASWTSLSHHTTTLYEEARQTRLGTEKFLVDGRHTGTGGGNHIVVGGATPADSPLLRRPDLLRSLIGYWHNHPSLSYLFSGMFIGPTSQHPRVDEARGDQVHELEIAMAQIDRLGDGLGPHAGPGPVPPWIVDRIFRNTLIDVTGNTHRAEFCIDKLYAPEGTSGRQGLLELRAFEMPPHARMSLAQQLLLRALIARFWDAPYRRVPVRWGTELHDRFMLPHFIADDFADVIGGLNDAGFPFEAGWFAPHQEFRFPPVGEVTYRGVHLELRHALEPWHVLGEEATGGGTARYVDSSLERLQIKVNGLVDGRHVIACNGREVPLHPTGTHGEYVAGLRYRAWQPPNALHPTIAVHTPLVFDVVDMWTGRSIGGCAYHVAHPGGRNHDTRPINAYEAEGRRLARFLAMGHTPGPLDPVRSERHPDHPFTLDLRRS